MFGGNYFGQPYFGQCYGKVSVQYLQSLVTQAATSVGFVKRIARVLEIFIGIVVVIIKQVNTLIALVQSTALQWNLRIGKGLEGLSVAYSNLGRFGAIGLFTEGISSGVVVKQTNKQFDGLIATANNQSLMVGKGLYTNQASTAVFDNFGIGKTIAFSSNLIVEFIRDIAISFAFIVGASVVIIVGTFKILLTIAQASSNLVKFCAISLLVVLGVGITYQVQVETTILIVTTALTSLLVQSQVGMVYIFIAVTAITTLGILVFKGLGIYGNTFVSILKKIEKRIQTYFNTNLVYFIGTRKALSTKLGIYLSESKYSKLLMRIAAITHPSIRKRISKTLIVIGLVTLTWQLGIGATILAVVKTLVTLSAQPQVGIVYLIVAAIGVATIGLAIRKRLGISVIVIVGLFKSFLVSFSTFAVTKMVQIKRIGKVVTTRVFSITYVSLRIGKGILIITNGIPSTLKGFLVSFSKYIVVFPILQNQTIKRIMYRVSVWLDWNKQIGKLVVLSNQVALFLSRGISKLLSVVAQGIAFLSQAKERLLKSGKAHLGQRRAHEAHLGEHGHE
jgi:hypothetical protein